MKNRVKRGRGWLIAALCFAIGARAFAQDLPKVPILEGTTYAVIRADLDKIDGNALMKWVSDGINEAIPEPEGRQQALQAIQPQLSKLVQAQQDMIKAGAPVVYFAFNEFPPNNGPLIYAPLAKGGNPETIRAIFYSGPGGTRKGPELAAVPAGQNMSITAAMPDGVFMGMSESYLRIKEAHIGAPHLLFALSQLQPAPFQVVAAPNEILSLMLETMLPQIPAPVDLPMTTFTRGISSASGTLTAPPDIAAKIVIQSQDPATAAQLKGTADKLLAMVNSPQIQRQMPGLDTQTLIAALTPKVQENQVIIEVNGTQSSKILLSTILPSLQRARQSATMVQSASQLRSLLVNALQHASQNQNTLPDSLEQLAAARFGGRLPPNPRAAVGQPGFVYVAKPGTKLADMKKDQILIYENIAALPPGTALINAGYVDGHVDALTLPTLQQRLAAQGAPAPTLR